MQYSTGPSKMQIAHSNSVKCHEKHGNQCKIGSQYRENRYQPLNDTQWLAHFCHGFCRLQQLFALVPSAHNRPQSGLTLGHGRKTHCGSKHAGLKQLLRELECLGGIADMDWNDWRLAYFELEPALLELS